MSKGKRKFIGFRNTNDISEKMAIKSKTPNHELSLSAALRLFVNAKEAENVRPRTIEEYLNHIRYLTDFLKMHLDVAEVLLSMITSENIYAYINHLKNDKIQYEDVWGRNKGIVGLSPTTINIRLRTLRTMCRFWHNENLIEHNPMEHIKNIRQDTDDSVRGFTDSEVRIILESYDVALFSDWRDKILCLLMLDTGLRPTEALELPISSIDFTSLSLEIYANVSKNRRSRIVPVSLEISKMLRALIDETESYFGKQSRVFVSAYGKPISADTFRKRLNRRKKRLGFERLSPNQFRHTFCRNYILNGGDIFTLQRIVGHRDIKTTRKYVQVDFEHVERQHESYSPINKILYRN